MSDILRILQITLAVILRKEIQFAIHQAIRFAIHEQYVLLYKQYALQYTYSKKDIHVLQKEKKKMKLQRELFFGKKRT